MSAVELGRRRVLRPGRLRWLRALGWMVALFVVVAAAYGLVSTLGLRLAVGTNGGPAGARTAASEGLKLLFVLLGVLAALAAYGAAVRYGEHRRLDELSPKALPVELIAGFVLGAALMVLTIGMMWLAGWAEVTAQPIARIGGAVRDTLQSSIVEETLFRLVIFRLCWRAFGIWTALAISAVLFGALHLSNPNASAFAALCIALEAGILLAAFYVLTGRAWAPIGVHAGWNFTQGWVFGAAVSGGSSFAGGPLATRPAADVATVLNGGAFGPEASLPGLVICTLAGVGTLWLAWRRGQFVPAADAGPATAA